MKTTDMQNCVLPALRAGDCRVRFDSLAPEYYNDRQPRRVAGCVSRRELTRHPCFPED